MSLPPTINQATFNNEAHRRAVLETLASINQTVSDAKLTQISNRPITEVEALKQEVAAVIPAGNIVGLVMGGLLRLRGRSLPLEQAISDMTALLRGLEVLPNNLLDSSLMAGPAAVLAAYQKLLTLTGKSLDSAFPEGLWQFYLEFALREDSARHANETVGFQQALIDYHLSLTAADQLAVWVCAASQICFHYDDLLYNEWREQTRLNLLKAAADEAGMDDKLYFQRLHWAWTTQRPYRRGQDAATDEDYVRYRQRRFDNFFQKRFQFLPLEQQQRLQATYAQREAEELAAYRQQMTILAALTPERYREKRTPIPLWQAQVGIIVRGNYYLLPVCYTDRQGYPLLFKSRTTSTTGVGLQVTADNELSDAAGCLLRVDRQGQVFETESGRLRGYLQPIQFQTVRRLVGTIIGNGRSETAATTLDQQLLALGRPDQERARQCLSPTGRQALQALRRAPILINWDEQAAEQPLAYIRRGRRGVGDQAVTIFRTPRSMIFDQSHIFFDGIWGIALSEILTGEAISWAAYFSRLEPPLPAGTPPDSLQLTYESALEKYTQTLPPEVSAESEAVHTQNLYRLLKMLPKRHTALKLTVNDLLVLYRCEFSHEYQPSAAVLDSLADAEATETDSARQAVGLLREVLANFQRGNPALMIPMNAIAAKPQERLYPTTFRNPFTELWDQYKKTVTTLNRYMVSQTQGHWAEFTRARHALLIQLNYFAQLLRAYKRVAMAGGSFNTTAMKLVAQVPTPLLKLLHAIPQQVDILNEMVKGEEVFSNVGRVARGSSLSRFISAKYDSDNKALSWGILTDNTDTLHIALREFRPYVTICQQGGYLDLAEMVIEDYLHAFTRGFNQFVASLLDISNAQATHVSGGSDSHET